MKRGVLLLDLPEEGNDIRKADLVVFGEVERLRVVLDPLILEMLEKDRHVVVSCLAVASEVGIRPITVRIGRLGSADLGRP